MSEEENVERCWLYSDDCPEGQIFEGDEIQTALRAGWRDSPDAENASPIEPAQVSGDTDPHVPEEE